MSDIIYGIANKKKLHHKTKFYFFSREKHWFSGQADLYFFIKIKFVTIFQTWLYTIKI